MSPQASSATATAFFPGQFETEIARADAPATSIVFTPAPARTIRERLLPWSISAAVTRVDRTTRTSAPVSRRRQPSDSPSRPGS